MGCVIVQRLRRLLPRRILVISWQLRDGTLTPLVTHRLTCYIPCEIYSHTHGARTPSLRLVEMAVVCSFITSLSSLEWDPQHHLNPPCFLPLHCYQRLNNQVGA